MLLGLGLRLGTELFPQVDSGEFVLRFRAAAGIELRDHAPDVRSSAWR